MGLTQVLLQTLCSKYLTGASGGTPLSASCSLLLLVCCNLSARRNNTGVPEGFPLEYRGLD